ncbi:MAG: cyclic nucleotide-binding domain-containing protein [Pseudobdellovibrio sp.]
MKIESEKVMLKPGVDVKKFGNLNVQQADILNLFIKHYSVLDVVQHYYAQKKLISFVAILEVIEMLIDKKLIMNVNYYDHFSKSGQLQSKVAGVISDLFSDKKDAAPVAVSDKNKVRSIPFFRSLNTELVDLFLKNSTLTPVAQGVTFCQEGSDQRSLIVLLQGQATVYKKNPQGGFTKIVVLTEGSLFGEAGFFLGTPRSASVMADKPCQILIIRYVPEVYENLIKTDKARELQARIWVIHALLKSEMFRSLPQESFDALIHAGEIKKIEARTVICRQGDIGESCYIIVQGKVSVHKNQKLVANLEQGDCFGEMALLVTGGPRTATVHAETDVIVLELHRAQFYKLLAENLLMASQFEKIAFERKPS